MSSETTNNSNMLSGLGTSLAFSGILSGGFGSLSTLKTYGKDSIKAVKDNNTVLKDYTQALINNGTGRDVFTRNLKTATNYQEYSRLAKQAAKLQKKVAKLEGKTDVSLITKFTNLFRSKENKVKINAIQKKYNDTYNETLIKLTGKNSQGIEIDIDNSAVSKLKNGNSIGELTKTTKKGEQVLTAAGALDKADDILSSSKALLKSEFKDPMNFIGAGIEIFTRVQSEVIPAFKNEGFGAGIKSLGKALAAGATSFVADAGFSVAFRTIGATIGGILGPAGSAVGMMVGNAVGAFFSNKVVQKIFPMKEDSTVQMAQNEQTMQDVEQSSEAQTTQSAQAIQTTQKTASNPIKEQPKVTRNGYIMPQNGVCATEWVNEGIKNGTIKQPYKQQLDMKA